MKTKLAVSLLLAFTMAAHSQPLQSGHSQTNNQAMLPVVVLIIGLGGAIVVVWAYEKNNKNPVIPRLTLQRSPDQIAWENVCTLTNVALNGTNKIKLFEQQINAEPHRDQNFYRAVCQ